MSISQAIKGQKRNTVNNLGDKTEKGSGWKGGEKNHGGKTRLQVVCSIKDSAVSIAPCYGENRN